MTTRRTPIRIAAIVALVLALLLGGTSVPAETRQICAGLTVDVVPFAFEQLSVTNAATPFTSATYAPVGAKAATIAIVSTEDADLRYRTDGSDPTSSVGHKVTEGQAFAVCGRTAITNFRAIRTASTNVKGMTTYYRAR